MSIGVNVKIKFRINSEKETRVLAENIANMIFPGMVIGLSGDLGSGKTTFTKYFAKAMGVGDSVNSPTFTLLKTYMGKLELNHMDVYRLEGVGYDYALDDYIYGSGVSVIEWYTYIEEMLPKDILKIRFTLLDDNKRDVLIEGSGIYEKILQKIGH